MNMIQSTSRSREDLSKVEPDRWDNTVRKVTHDNLIPEEYRNPTSNELKYHSHLPRKTLRRMDLLDLKKKRKPLSKPAYISRVKNVFRSAKAQSVAKAYAGRLRSACRQVLARGGAAADN